MARALGALGAPHPLTGLIVLALDFSLVLALRLGLRRRAQLSATTARVQQKQTVLEVLANLAQLAARADLSVAEAAGAALDGASPTAHGRSAADRR